MSTYKRGTVYWYEFEFKGERVRESTYQGNGKVALNMQAAHRARLVTQSQARDAARERLDCAEVLTCHECEKLFNADKAVRKEDTTFCSAKCVGVWGKARSMPTLKGFLDDRFVPAAKVTHKAKPKTYIYYRQGAAMLKRSKLSEIRLDELTGEHAGQFEAEFGHLSPSGINMGLRTLRRALNLAYQWGQIERPVKVALAKGENQRDRVLTEDELTAYLPACPQPWRDAATMIAEEGMRPGEVVVVRWEHLFMGDDTGLIRVVDGKSKAAKRILPMTPVVLAMLKARWEAQGKPATGFVFASESKAGHIGEQNIKRYHAAALEASKVAPFVPYCLRHTALTRIAAAAGGDPFSVARIAGHSSITISQKYVHPEAETIEQVFAKLSLANAARKELLPESPTVGEGEIMVLEGVVLSG